MRQRQENKLWSRVRKKLDRRERDYLGWHRRYEWQATFSKWPTILDSTVWKHAPQRERTILLQWIQRGNRELRRS